MLSTRWTALIGLIFLTGFSTNQIQAEGDRGTYSGFGVPMRETSGLTLTNTPTAPAITTTAYKVSRAQADGFQVVDEHAAVKFRLVGLPENVKAASYNVAWTFDGKRQGAIQHLLKPSETSSVDVRYNTCDSNHRLVE